MSTPRSTPKQIIELYQAGLAPIAIARKLEVSRQRVHQVLIKLPGYIGRATAVAERRVKVLELYQSGQTTRKIGKTLGLPRAAINADLGALEIRGLYHQRIAARREQIRLLRSQKVAQVEIARRLGVPKATVINDVLKMGLKRRHRGTPQEVATRREKVRALWKSDLSLPQISKLVGAPISTLIGDVAGYPKGTRAKQGMQPGGH